MPRVSVIIPSYNSADFLPVTLKSVLAQTYNDLEIIVIDDGSTDNTSEVVAALNSSKIKYIYQPNSGGPSSPRNTGIRKSIGKYIFLFDSDDIMLPEKIECSVRFLDSIPSLGFVFTDFAKYGEVGGAGGISFLTGYDRFWNVKKQDVGNKCYIIKSSDAYQTLFYENYIGTSGVVIPRGVLESLGLFDESLKNSDDKDMWFRISRKYDIGFINMIGHYYRARDNSISSRGSNLAEYRIRVIRRQLENNLKQPIRRQANKLVADNFYGIGYQFQYIGNMKGARENYLLSLKEYFNWRALKGILITFFPQKLFFISKKLRNKTTHRNNY